MRVSGYLFALCLCFSALSAQFSVMQDDSSTESRESEGASSVTYDNKIYITGGTRKDPVCATCPPQTETVSRRLRIYDIGLSSFISPLPEPMYLTRSHHSSVLYGDKIVVFGGAGENTDLEQYDISEGHWSVITIKKSPIWRTEPEKPSGRHSHGVAVIGNLMFLFGGFDAVSGDALNDLWTFDFNTQIWKHHDKSYGWAPNPRGGFSLNAAVIGGIDHLVLFGGKDSASKYYNELWTFNTNTHEWKHITPSNGPSPRAFHTAVIFENSQLVIFGGSSASKLVHGLLDYYNDVWTISIARVQLMRRWTAVKFEQSNLADFPAPRHNHVSSARSTTNGEHHYFIIAAGAGEKRDTLADVWQCELIVDPEDVGVDGSEVLAPEFGENSGKVNISAAQLYRFNRFFGKCSQSGCFPGHVGKECGLDCRANNNCSGNGQCLFDGSCCCDEGFTGNSCDVPTCAEYKAFAPHELNKILLPASIETALDKLADLKVKLAYLQSTLPSVDYSQVNMSSFAQATYAFSEYCLSLQLNPQIGCLDEIVGCEEPCGEETPCWVGDECVDGQCIGGHSVNCSHLINSTNMCQNAWCDPLSGECKVSTVNCDDENACTEDVCDPHTGACSYHSLAACDDGSCCTLDSCIPDANGKPVCYHESKCEDENPCTEDSCCENCSFGTCSYQWESGCYLSKGQNTQLDPSDPSAKRHNGDTITLSGANVIGGIPHNDSIKANAYFWLQSEACKLIYDINYDDTLLGKGDYETGAFFYGNANKNENAGVIASLPLGPRKLGFWSYCQDGVTLDSLRNGAIYVEIYFSTGAIRAQVEFYNGPLH